MRSGLSSASGDLHYTYHPLAGARNDVPYVVPDYLKPDYDPWAPFSCGAEFNLARWFIDHEVSERAIDSFFKLPGVAALYPDLDNPGQFLRPRFRTGQQMFKLFVKLKEYPPRFFTTKMTSIVDDTDCERFHYRNIINTIKSIAKQHCFQHRFQYKPAIAKLDNGEGERVYADIHTSLSWNRLQNELRDQTKTIIPIFLMSDGVHLTQLSGSKEVWPIYMAIGNLSQEDRMKLAGRARMLIGFLPLPPATKDDEIHNPESQKQRNRAVTTACLRQLLKCLRDLGGENSFSALCPDGYHRQFAPRLVAYIADHKEAVNIHGVSSKRCLKCELPAGEFQNYHTPAKLRTMARCQHRYDEYFEELANLVREGSAASPPSTAPVAVQYKPATPQVLATAPANQFRIDANIRSRAREQIAQNDDEDDDEDEDPDGNYNHDESHPEDQDGVREAETQAFLEDEDSTDENITDMEDDYKDQEDDQEYGTQNIAQNGKKKRRKLPAPLHRTLPLSQDAKLPAVGDDPDTAAAHLLSIMADYRPGKNLERENAIRKQQRKMVQEYGLQLDRNNLSNLPGVEPGNVHQADALHVLVLGIFCKNHLMDWVLRFLAKHRRLKIFHNQWVNMPAYKDFRKPRKKFLEIKQWQGNEMKSFIRILVTVFEKALYNPAPHQKAVFATALRCVSSIVDFHLMCMYPSHTESTLEWMDRYLSRFHLAKMVFIEFRINGKTTRAAKRKVDELLGPAPKTKAQLAREAQDALSRTQHGTQSGTQTRTQYATHTETQNETQSATQLESQFTTQGTTQAGTQFGPEAKTRTNKPRKKRTLEEQEEAKMAAKETKKEKEAAAARKKLDTELRWELADFNFPKMHAAGHFHDTGLEIGSLLQTSTEMGEAPHTRIKAAYDNTNGLKPELQMINRLEVEHAISLTLANLRHAAEELAKLGPKRCSYNIQDRLELYNAGDKRRATTCRRKGQDPVLALPQPETWFRGNAIMRATLSGPQTRTDKVKTFEDLNTVYGDGLGYSPQNGDANKMLNLVREFYIREGEPLDEAELNAISSGTAARYKSVRKLL